MGRSGLSHDAIVCPPHRSACNECCYGEVMNSFFLFAYILREYTPCILLATVSVCGGFFSDVALQSRDPTRMAQSTVGKHLGHAIAFSAGNCSFFKRNGTELQVRIWDNGSKLLVTSRHHLTLVRSRSISRKLSTKLIRRPPSSCYSAITRRIRNPDLSNGICYTKAISSSDPIDGEKVSC